MFKTEIQRQLIGHGTPRGQEQAVQGRVGQVKVHLHGQGGGGDEAAVQVHARHLPQQSLPVAFLQVEPLDGGTVYVANCASPPATNRSGSLTLNWRSRLLCVPP